MTTEATTTTKPAHKGKQKEIPPANYSVAHEQYFALDAAARKLLNLTVASRQRLGKGVLPEGAGMVALAIAGLDIRGFAQPGTRLTSEGNPLRGASKGPRVSVFEASPVGQAVRHYVPSATIKTVAEILGVKPSEALANLRGERTPTLTQVRKAQAGGIPDTVWAEVPEAMALAASRRAAAQAKAAQAKAAKDAAAPQANA